MRKAIVGLVVLLLAGAGYVWFNQPVQTPLGTISLPEFGAARTDSPGATPSPTATAKAPKFEPKLKPQRPGWRDVTVKEGLDRSAHPDVPWDVQDRINHCGKTPLENTKANRAKGVVWLTFDDRVDDPARADQILDALKEHKVRGRFFLVGAWAQQHPQLLRRIRTEGHFLGNHSENHTALFDVKVVDRKADSWKVRDKSRELIEDEVKGGVPSQLVRPPFGAYDDRVLAILSRMKGPEGKPLQACNWTVDSLDWDHDRTPTPAAQLKTIQDGMSPNAVVLMHLHGRFTLQILGDLIKWLHDNSYRTEALPA
jgi:peptidoglycan-N-acetylglucosamine deacetylase